MILFHGNEALVYKLNYSKTQMILIRINNLLSVMVMNDKIVPNRPGLPGRARLFPYRKN